MGSSFLETRDRYLATGKMAPKTALEQWRAKARKKALDGGARWACGVCKRPIGSAATATERAKGRFGLFTLRSPNGWRTRSRIRKLCFSCYMYFGQMLHEAEFLFIEDHLPAEILGEEEQEDDDEL